MSNREMVFELASTLRAAIEITPRTGTTLESFPFYSCGVATALLCEYLLQHGIKSRYHCGECYYGPEMKYQTHAWTVLENGIIVDITGDQFKEKAEFLNNDIPVYVGPTNSFYDLFTGTQTDHEGGMNYYYPPDIQLRALYNRIIANICPTIQKN